MTDRMNNESRVDYDTLSRELDQLRMALKEIINKHYQEYPRGHRIYCDDPLNPYGCTCGFRTSEARARQALDALFVKE